MALQPVIETIPLRTDTDGVIRVGNTRVTLDTLLIAFKDGATAEEIAQQYPSVTLADVYSVIGYYLHRQSEIDAYLAARQYDAEQVRSANETRFASAGIRERLMARQRRSE